MSGASDSPERLPVVLQGGDIVAALPAQDQLLPLLLGAVLERLRELPAAPGQVASIPPLVDVVRSAALSVSAAADALGISASLAYRLVREGELPSVRLGRRLVVPRMAIERVLAMAVTRAVEVRTTRDARSLETQGPPSHGERHRSR